jgi:hypothetical protein
VGRHWRAGTITASLHHCITASPHHCITASPHHRITASPHHRITAALAAAAGDSTGAHAANDAARDPAEMPPDWERYLEFAPPMPLVRICFPILHAIAGDLDRARAEFEEFRELPARFPVGVRWGRDARSRRPGRGAAR